MIVREPERVAGYDGGTVSTRGNYRIGPFNGVYPRPGGPSPYRSDGVPGRDDDATPDEVAVFVHGFLVDRRQANATFRIVRDGLRFYGYDAPVVGFTWDASGALAVDDWYPTVAVARRNGRRLAAFVRDYRRLNPDAAVRLVGHSLGAQVVLSALERLSGGDDGVDSVTLLGGAVDDDAPSFGVGDYGDAIATAAGRVDNYHSRNDDRLRRYYPAVEFDAPVGTAGADGDTPANYTDHDVADVDGHLRYYRERVGCLDDVLQAWGTQPAPSPP
jgi:pimeloyl-ACP methyl ester carboxylesterase